MRSVLAELKEEGLYYEGKAEDKPTRDEEPKEKKDKKKKKRKASVADRKSVV